MGIRSFISGIIGNLVPNSCASGTLDPGELMMFFWGGSTPCHPIFWGNKCLQTMLEDELILMGDTDRFAPRCREV